MSKNLEQEAKVIKNDGVSITLTKGGLFSRIFGCVLDQVIVLGVASLLMVVFNLILRLFGFMIVEFTPMLLIFFFIVNCLYSPLMERMQDGRTLGKRIMNII